MVTTGLIIIAGGIAAMVLLVGLVKLIELAYATGIKEGVYITRFPADDRFPIARKVLRKAEANRESFDGAALLKSKPS